VLANAINFMKEMVLFSRYVSFFLVNLLNIYTVEVILPMIYTKMSH
jgi:hypothetical protein